MKSNLCSVSELKQRLGSSSLSLIDGSWYMPAAKRNCRQEYQQQSIPGAVFFDIDAICDLACDLPHMLPSANEFAKAMTALGVENHHHIVVYDTAGLFSAARVWWMFKLFGHDKVQILAGGLPEWVQQGNDLTPGRVDPTKINNQPYTAKINETFLVDKDVLIKNSLTAEYLVLDARPHGRFTGELPEPRVGLPSGHMPQSKSLPFDQLVEAGSLKSRLELQRIFRQFGLDPKHDSQPLVTSCGSGVTAAIITLALVEAGFSMHKLYDGAWSEWACADDTTVLKGA